MVTVHGLWSAVPPGAAHPMRSLALALPSGRLLASLVVGVVLIAALAAGGWFWSASHQNRAAAAYANVLGRLASTLGQPLAPEARVAAQRELETALARYPSGALAGQAAYTLGNLRYADRDYPRARAAYEVALASGTGSRTIRTLARVGVGYTWEVERNFPKAIEVYQAVASELKVGEFYYEDALMNLARAQESADRKGDAIATYRRILKDRPSGLRVDDARSRLAALESRP